MAGAKDTQRRKPGIRQRLLNWTGRVFFNGAQRFSRRSLLRFASWIAKVFYNLSNKHRGLIKTHLAKAFPDSYSESELSRLALKNLDVLARSMVDFVKSRSMTRDELMSLYSVVCDPSHLQQAKETSKNGIIGLTGHFGNWELSAHWVSQNGFPLTAVGRDQSDEALNEQIVAIREKWGTDNVARSRFANKALISALKQGRMLGLLSDQNAGKNGLFVPFFGDWASTFRGPAIFALKFDCPVIPIFNVRQDDDSYKLIIGPRLELIRDDDKEYEIWATTYRMQRYIEALLTKYPEQWMWLHKRWKSRPDQEAVETGERFLKRYEAEVRDEFIIP